ncbi:hypothetical protein [Streptomyces sp. NPDC001222]|uniref:hypothetical protein n=1 Tax=Streptomyces sp. NPDC001222 TaxID=3364548 RepID=UPI00367CFDCD
MGIAPGDGGEGQIAIGEVASPGPRARAGPWSRAGWCRGRSGQAAGAARRCHRWLRTSAGSTIKGVVAELLDAALLGRIPVRPDRTQAADWALRLTTLDKVDRGQGLAGALTSDEKEELRRLRRENREQQQTVEILKKAAAFFAKESTK